MLNPEKSKICIKGETIKDAACKQNDLPTPAENISESRCVTVSFKGAMLEEHSPSGRSLNLSLAILFLVSSSANEIKQV